MGGVSSCSGCNDCGVLEALIGGAILPQLRCAAPFHIDVPTAMMRQVVRLDVKQHAATILTAAAAPSAQSVEVPWISSSAGNA